MLPYSLLSISSKATPITSESCTVLEMALPTTIVLPSAPAI